MIELIIVGNVGSVRHRTVNETSILNISIASTRRFGEKEYTDWIAATVWGERGEKLRPFISVGQKLLLRGRPEVRSYRRTDGTSACELVLHVRQLEFLSPRPKADAASVQEQPEQKARKGRKSASSAA